MFVHGCASFLLGQRVLHCTVAEEEEMRYVMTRGVFGL